MKTNIKTYYKNRASVYEESMYFKNEPNRLKEAKKIDVLLRKLFRQKEIIEVACGTGYWTNVLSTVAKNIKATDAVEEVINIAKNKKYSCAVDFKISDASSLSYQDKTFDGGVACFWFSHMLRKDISKFLREFNRVLKSGSMVFLCDNVSGYRRWNFNKKR
jgi:ubiquinone/menaquinone biosynthesis C-methylase UbiE